MQADQNTPPRGCHFGPRKYSSCEQQQNAITQPTRWFEKRTRPTWTGRRPSGSRPGTHSPSSSCRPSASTVSTPHPPARLPPPNIHTPPISRLAHHRSHRLHVEQKQTSSPTMTPTAIARPKARSCSVEVFRSLHRCPRSRRFATMDGLTAMFRGW